MRRVLPRSAGAASILAGFALTAACGTTVPVAEQRLPGTVSAFGGEVAPGATSDGVVSGLADDGLGGVQDPGQVGGGAVAAAAPTKATGVAGAATNGPGDGRAAGSSTASTITIGALTATGAGQYQRSLGFDQGASGDQIAMTRSVVQWLNKHGGIAGRKVELVVYDVPVEQAVADANSAYEAACRAFTEDNKVFAVVSIVSDVTDNFYECLRKRGVFAITANIARSSHFFQQWAGAVYGPTNPSYTRVLANSVDALWEEGWLTPTSKVGVVGFETADAKATINDGLVPALKRHGLELTADFYTTTDSSGYAAYNGAALRFKTRDVDRVFFAPGGQPILFGLAAEQANYRPLYALSTLEYPGPVAATLPPEQLRGSAGIGWSPWLDLDNASAAKMTTPGKAECIDAVSAARQDLATGTTFAIATWICDDW
jgi:ABC-type branched-subunit amino acid transport system substrate-binding protein